MRLKHHGTGAAPISLVAMIDVLMIMLVFFMVTSTYLNLRMIPVARSTETPPAEAPGSGGGDGADPSAPLLVRLDAGGQAHLRGQPVSLAALQATLATRLDDAPETQVIVLPSGRARTQALVSLLDAVTTAGVERLRIVRLEDGA